MFYKQHHQMEETKIKEETKRNYKKKLLQKSFSESDSHEDVSDYDYDDELDQDRLLHVKGERRNFGGVGSSKSMASNRIMARINMEPSVRTPSQSFKNTVSSPRQREQLVSHSVMNSIKQSEKKAEAPRKRGLTRDTRATVELVLDPRTIQILERLMKWNIFTELYGCISTGKEANVYLGIVKPVDNTTKIQQRAIKVFKTSILIFKDRARYVEGEFRFRRAYAGSTNPRKMVRQWAEKEYRNLRRLMSNGIRSPLPVELRGHVIAMGFLGSSDGSAAPKLKEMKKLKSKLTESFWRRIYIETIATLRLLFQECKLVHGDFSEYNLLFHQGHPYVIDVSQAVEQDHPQALDFLKRDCVNVNRFFSSILLGNYDDDSDVDSKASTEINTEIIQDESQWSSKLVNFKEEAEVVIGHRIKMNWPLYPICVLFDYITKPDFLLVDPGRMSEWVEFDLEERQQMVNSDAVATSRPMPQYSKKPKPKSSVVNSPNEHDTTAETTTNETHYRRFPCLDGKILERSRNHFRCLCIATLEDLYNRFISIDSNCVNSTPAQQLEEHIFLNTWTPSSLQQVRSLSIGGLIKFVDGCVVQSRFFQNPFPLQLTILEDLEEEIEKQKQGKGSKYIEYLAPSAFEEKVLDEDDTEQNSNDDSEESFEKPELNALDDNDNANSSLLLQLNRGRIPSGVDPKEWKKRVKEEQREKRKKKVPKHIKKKNKKKATNSK